VVNDTGQRSTTAVCGRRRRVRQRRLVVGPISAAAAGDAIQVVVVDGRVLYRRLVRTEQDVQLRRSPSRLPGHTEANYSQSTKVLRQTFEVPGLTRSDIWKKVH